MDEMNGIALALGLAVSSFLAGRNSNAKDALRLANNQVEYLRQRLAAAHSETYIPPDDGEPLAAHKSGGVFAVLSPPFKREDAA